MDPEINFSKGVTEVVPLGGAHPSGGAKAADYAQRSFSSAQDEAQSQFEYTGDGHQSDVVDLGEFRRSREDQ